MRRPFATIILAGGKGTRMGSGDKHKVCFEVLGVPVIIRALETYNLCGAMLNVVVVGSMAESVMGTVNRRFPSTRYAFQDQPLGTGDAARNGAELLERMRFDGDVLVAAGDKVIDSRVICDLLGAHEQSGADVTLATAKRPLGSSAGIVLKSAQGNIVGILEEAERRRRVALGKINEAFRKSAVLPWDTVERILVRECGEKTARRVRREIWGEEEITSEGRIPQAEVRSRAAAGGSFLERPVFEEKAGAERVLRRADFEGRFAKDEQLGWLTVAGEAVPANQVLGRFNQMNLSTYLFRAPVLYDALSRLTTARVGQEEYLTDVFEILAGRPEPARVMACEVQDARDLMTFNTPEELKSIEEVFRQRQAAARAASEGRFQSA